LLHGFTSSIEKLGDYLPQLLSSTGSARIAISARQPVNVIIRLSNIFENFSRPAFGDQFILGEISSSLYNSARLPPK
jgi:hypothetical protein